MQATRKNKVWGEQILLICMQPIMTCIKPQLLFHKGHILCSLTLVTPTRHSNIQLTLLLKSCHDLHICHVLQFVAHRDAVVLQLRHTHLTVQGRLGADGCVPASHVWRHTGQSDLSHQEISLSTAKNFRQCNRQDAEKTFPWQIYIIVTDGRWLMSDETADVTGRTGTTRCQWGLTVESGVR